MIGLGSLGVFCSGLAVGWNAAFRAAARHRPTTERAGRACPDHPEERTGPAPACRACHGSGRVPAFSGRLERCGCGARSAMQHH